MTHGSPGGAGPTSVRSPRVSAVRKLRQRSEREARGLFVAEGPQAVAEAASAVQEVYATAEAAPQWPGAVVVPDEVLQAMAETRNPQGVLAVCRFVDVALDTIAAPRLSALLWQINDPGNAGTVLRTADAAGADAVLFSTGSVDVYNGKCVRSTAGSLFHVPVVRDVDPLVAIGALRSAGCTVLAADGGGAATLYELLPSEPGGEGVLAGPVAWVFGNEARGLDPAIAGACDLTVSIPHAGRAESLNLAAAASLCLMTSAAAQAGRIVRGA
jgi:TrmH family RNA methyltransferase